MKSKAIDKIIKMVDELDDSKHVEPIINYCALFYKTFNDHKCLSELLPQSLYTMVCSRIIHNGWR